MTEIPKAREVVEELREQVNNGNSKPLEGIAKHRLIDKLQEIVEIKEERVAMLEAEIEYDKERLLEIGERQQELIAELKSHGVPHHPVMGSKMDYEQAEPKDSFDKFLEAVTDSEEDQEKIKEFMMVSTLPQEETPEDFTLV